MALVETAGAAYVQSSATNVQAAASFTPSANVLVVAIVGVGNGNGVTATTPFLAVSSTFGGTATNTWTTLVSEHVAGDGLAAVFVMDAGSAATAGVVTATATPSTVLNPGLIVRQFAGAKAAASQTGVTAVGSGTIDSVSITPGTTGSQVVGAFGAPTTGAVTANGVTTIYGQTQGSAGDTLGCFEATSLSTSGTPISLGWTATKASTCIAVAEILPAASTVLPFVSPKLIQAVKRASFY